MVEHEHPELERWKLEKKELDEKLVRSYEQRLSCGVESS